MWVPSTELGKFAKSHRNLYRPSKEIGVWQGYFMTHIDELRSELIGLINEEVELDSYFPINQIEKRNIRTLDFKEYQRNLIGLRCVRNFTKMFMDYLFEDQHDVEWKKNSPQWADLKELIPTDVHKMLSEGITKKEPKQLICYYDRRYAINEFVQQPTLHLYIHLDPSTHNYACIFFMNIELIY